MKKMERKGRTHHRRRTGHRLRCGQSICRGGCQYRHHRAHGQHVGRGAGEPGGGLNGIEALFVVADGGDEEAVKNVVKPAAERFGRLDCLVNNAQVSKSGTMLVDHTKEDFDLAIYSGLYATFFYMREAFPYLKESRGSVMGNSACGAGLFGKLGQSPYAAAKGGRSRGLSRVAAAEWGPFGVNVNAGLSPGVHDAGAGKMEGRISQAVCSDHPGHPAGPLRGPGKGRRACVRVSGV